jgi:lipopolysaccharide export LptBFGC system permease protein LptF
LLGAAPIAMRYGRNRPLFLIVACSLLALISFKTMIDSMLILGENQVLAPWVAIWVPMVGVFLLTSLSFFKKVT